MFDFDQLDTCEQGTAVAEPDAAPAIAGAQCSVQTGAQEKVLTSETADQHNASIKASPKNRVSSQTDDGQQKQQHHQQQHGAGEIPGGRLSSSVDWIGDEEYIALTPSAVIYDAPKLSASKVGNLLCGNSVSGCVQDAWLCLDAASCEEQGLKLSVGAYILVDGSKAGLSLQLKRCGPLAPCGEPSRLVYHEPVELLLREKLTVYQSPSLKAPQIRHLYSGTTASGYPLVDWFELADQPGWMHVPAAHSELFEASALKANIRRTFANSMLVDWEELPLKRRALYTLEWTSSEDDDACSDYVVRRPGTLLRGLPPFAHVNVRICAQIFGPLRGGISSGTSPLIGRWLYGSKPSEYRVDLVQDSLLRFEGPHSGAGRVSGVLRAEGPGQVADLTSPAGSKIGAIRLRYEEFTDTVISNFRGVGKVEWGKNIIARRGGQDCVYAKLAGPWCETFTERPVSECEERDRNFDPFGNLRKECELCDCPCYVDCVRDMPKTLEEVRCRRCGCSVSGHKKGERWTNMRDSAGPHKVEPASRTAARIWTVKGVIPGQDPAQYVIEKLAAADTLYAILGLEANAPASEVQRAYREIALAVHPDKVQARLGMEPEVVRDAEAAFKLVSGAHEVLGDQRRRRKYDSEMQIERRTETARPRPAPPKKTVGHTRGLHQHPLFDLLDPLGAHGPGSIFGDSGYFTSHSGGAYTWQMEGGGTIFFDTADNFEQRLQHQQEVERLSRQWG